MTKFLGSEEAIAYGIVMFFFAIILSAFLFYVFHEPIDVLTGVLNEMIVAGEITTETTDNIQILLKLFLFGIPFFVIISTFEYAIVRALEAKKEGGYL